ncbi:MAG: TetR family transcriptional regulator [Ilumatobacteraceae bacterium]
MNQRELQRARTRQTLADHALRLFDEQGFDDTTVEQIVAAAGVSQRTFFLHFTTKAAAAFPDHAERVESFRTRLGPGARHDSPLPHLVTTMASGLQAHTPMRRIRYGLLARVSALQDEDARTDRDYERIVVEYLIDCWGSSVAARVRANAIANAVLGVVRASLIAWSVDGIDPVTVSYDLMRAMLCSPFELPATLDHDGLLGAATAPVGPVGPGAGA